MTVDRYSTHELRALLDTCHRLREFDSWFDALAREYRTRVDRKPLCNQFADERAANFDARMNKQIW